MFNIIKIRSKGWATRFDSIQRNATHTKTNNKEAIYILILYTIWFHLIFIASPNETNEKYKDTERECERVRKKRNDHAANWVLIAITNESFLRTHIVSLRIYTYIG